jgi:hypothetical protein
MKGLMNPLLFAAIMSTESKLYLLASSQISELQRSRIELFLL